MLLIAVVLSFVGCRPNSFPVGEVKDDYFPLINVNAWTTAASYDAGATISLELQYLSYSPIREITFVQIVTRRANATAPLVNDTTVIFRTPYRPAFSATKQCDTLLLNYTVPNAATLPRPVSPATMTVRLGAFIFTQNVSKGRLTNTFTLR